MNTMDFCGKRHSRLCLGKLPIQWQHHHSNVESISDSWIVLLPHLWHLLHCPMATHASYENWSYHNGYGNGCGHFLDGVTYYPFYQNQPYYELNTYGTNPFLPSDCSDCIFISGLPKTIQKDEIISIFSKAGKIKFTKYGTLSQGCIVFILPHAEFRIKYFQEPREYSYSWTGERRHRQETRQLLMNHLRAQKMQSTSSIRWISMDMESYQWSKPCPIKRIPLPKSWWVYLA